MIVEPRIAAPFLERAAAEQLRDQLTADGYTVSLEEAFGDARADLIARAAKAYPPPPPPAPEPKSEFE